MAPSEWVFVPGGVRLAAWGEHPERIDTTALTAALAALATRHPLLAATIEPAPSGWRFHARSAPPVPVARPRGTRVEEELARIGATKAADTLHVAVLPGQDTDTVVLVLHHAVADHASTASLNSELTELYAVARSGLPLPPETPGSTPAPMEAAIDTTRFTAADITRYAARRGRTAAGLAVVQLPHRGGAGPSGYSVEHLRFSEHATADLAATARRARISMHALTCGALLAAARSMHPGPRETTAPLVCHMPVDMRRRLRIPRQAQVFATSGYHAILHLTADHGAVHAGQQITAQFHEAVRGGELELEVLALEQLLEQPPLPVTVGVTDLGRYPRPGASAAADESRPLISAGLPQVAAPFPVVAASVVHGQLRISSPCFHAWFDPETVKQFMAHTHTHLGAARERS
ncbi:hypothetical protein AB0I00_04250 [Streptomyces sp. NPDC050803]|uniref:phthiocerol/phthiodiolone dimycocerosyl transferase family protein n=1 Tax=unclassified Streptomyces TaxID=2593676 RepID=UPI003433FEA2